MTEAIGYLILSYRANTLMLIVAATFMAIPIVTLPFVMEDMAPSTRKTFFKYLSIIFLTLTLTTISVSWYYQTRATESCAKDPSCDYVKADKTARNIINPDTLVFTQ